MKTFSLYKIGITILTGVLVSIFSCYGYAQDWDETFPPVFNLTNLNGTNGFAIRGVKQHDSSGSSVSGVGDVNGDGIDDVLISADWSMQGYVLFGSKQSWSEAISLGSLNGQNGFVITGVGANCVGCSVSGAGDINGDGIDDILIGIPMNDISFAGISYVLFGSKTAWPERFNLADLNGNNGFSIEGISNTFSGTSVSGAGDVNGDGIDDILIGFSDIFILFNGAACVVFGKKEPWNAVNYIKDLNGVNGSCIYDTTSYAGYSVSGAGDMNGDGIDDILIGSSNIDVTYVVFGTKSWPDSINLGSLNGTDGFVINGVHLTDEIGTSVSRAGDVNGDGIADIAIGAPFANNATGQSYILFGSKVSWPAAIYLANLNGKNGFAVNVNGIVGGSTGTVVARAGDVNGDGIDDILIGVPGFPEFPSKGLSYIIFGSKKPWPASIDRNNLNGTNGFIINGINSGDYTGIVSGAGDLNGDGIADILIGSPGWQNLTGQSYVIFGSKANP